MVLLLSPSDILEIGLKLLHLVFRLSTPLSTKRLEFQRQYGSKPNTLAEVWYDVQEHVDESDQSQAGFRSFMVAVRFLWTYPRNSSVLAQGFQICERYCRGDPVWRWVANIASLKASKIVWPASLDSPDSDIFVVTVDGVDFKTWEKKHPLLNQDRQMYSHKHNKCAVKYEIGISVFTSKCVWIAGPFRGAKGDLSIYQGKEDAKDRGLREELGRPEYECLEDKIADGKLAIGDRAYGAGKNTAVKRNEDPGGLHNFKSRALSRHETFNGRLTKYAVLRECFRHGFTRHPLAMEAVCVIVQYQMDLGDELFAV